MANRVYFPKTGQVMEERISSLLPKIGNPLMLAGIILQGQGQTIQLFFPYGDRENIVSDSFNPTIEEWAAILAQSDDPMLFEADETGLLKPFVRKAQYAISGDVQQRVWARDGFKCMYCHKPMGVVTLTIDHFMPLELGGANDPSNYLSACRKCNRRKGNMHPLVWCEENGGDYQFFLDYLNRSYSLP